MTVGGPVVESNRNDDNDDDEFFPSPKPAPNEPPESSETYVGGGGEEVGTADGTIITFERRRDYWVSVRGGAGSVINNNTIF